MLYVAVLVEMFSADKNTSLHIPNKRNELKPHLRHFLKAVRLANIRSLLRLLVGKLLVKERLTYAADRALKGRNF